MSKLKVYFCFLLVNMMMLSCMHLFSATVSAATSSRVIYQVEQLSDHSVRITLSWLDTTVMTPIRMTSWQVNNGILEVSYVAGVKEMTGWNSREIVDESVSFPIKIILKDINAAPHTSVFSDVGVTNTNYNSFLTLYQRGILSGYPDGKFKPTQGVSRAEFSQMLFKTASYKSGSNFTTTFTDVSATYWARNVILTLAQKGILTGKTAQIFDPLGSVKIGEVMAVIDRTFETYDAKTAYTGALSAHWSNEAFKALVIQGIVLPSDSFYKKYTPNSNATREQCAVLLSRVLEKLHDTTP